MSLLGALLKITEGLVPTPESIGAPRTRGQTRP